MIVRIEKKARLLTVLHDGGELFTARVALGPEPAGAKRRAGDGKTPEGLYHICLFKEKGKYGLSLGLDYPGPVDAETAFIEGRIDGQAFRAILSAHAEGRRPPWGTALGGEIYLHGGGSFRDWTQGCIALDQEDMARLFKIRRRIQAVEILP